MGDFTEVSMRFRGALAGLNGFHGEIDKGYTYVKAHGAYKLFSLCLERPL